MTSNSENEGRMSPERKIRMLFTEEERTNIVVKSTNIYHNIDAFISLSLSLLVHTLKTWGSSALFKIENTNLPYSTGNSAQYYTTR